jgi:hypothetical protein
MWAMHWILWGGRVLDWERPGWLSAVPWVPLSSPGNKSGIAYAKGLARAAHDAGVKFGLSKDFHKHAGLFRTDNMVRDCFHVKRNVDILPAAKKFAQAHDLDEATQHATAIYVLEDTQKAAKIGFVAAQVALAALDVIASVGTLGGYAVAAPAVHVGVGSGQAVTTKAIQADLNRHKTLYADSLTTLKRKAQAKQAQKDAKNADKMVADAQAAAQARIDTAHAASAAEKPWYVRPPVIGAGILLIASVVGYYTLGREE